LDSKTQGEASSTNYQLSESKKTNQNDVEGDAVEELVEVSNATNTILVEISTMLVVG